MQDPSTKVLRVNIETFQGVPQLSGFEDPRQNAARAGNLVGGIDDVRSVDNDVTI